jgi:predicted ribosome quality control (RQC) complex YloA/Tae2 family protein
VGRSDAENDLLTHRFASPSDLWFHAQGSAGSHVILKGAHPSTPRTVIEKAASIAAYFSKARHSSTVPVIYTEKRHVRKPRKSKAGTATCSRSKTVFVKPSLPDDAETQ